MSTVFLLLVALNVQASTTVTVDSNDQVTTVTQPIGFAQPAATPAVMARETAAGDFQARIIKIDYARGQIVAQDINGSEREVVVQPEMVNFYRVGDVILVHPAADLTVITLEQNPKDFEGEIIRVDMSKSQIVVVDTNGRERRVQLKQGMIATYKVDDYVRIHLMEDLKEAKTIETIRGTRNIQGNIVSVDAPRSRIVVRGTDGKESTVVVRQGQIQNYRTGDHVRVYLLENNEQVQVIRVIR